MKRYFPWRTIALLGLTTYLLVIVLSIWWQAMVNALAVGIGLVGGPAWQATISFSGYFPGEPWVDAGLLHAGAGFLVWRWWALIKALWTRYGP